ncbi:MAG: hypothetical protein QXU79_00615 [Candidatus Micrarchaeaceae archaeon]
MAIGRRNSPWPAGLALPPDERVHRYVLGNSSWPAEPAFQPHETEERWIIEL